MKKILIAIFVASSIIGCVSNEVAPPSPISRQKMMLVKYGMPYKKVVDILNHPGKPMFRFGVGKEVYYISLYRPSHQYNNYLFLYENDALISIVNVKKALEIWKKEFGSYGDSLPKEKKFRSVIAAFKKYREPIWNFSFFEVRDVGHNKPYAGATMIEAGTVYSWIPGAFQVLVGGGVVVAGVEEVDHKLRQKGYVNSDRTDAAPIKIKSRAYYDAILKRFDAIKIGMSYKDVTSELGEPTYYRSDRDQGVLVYKGEDNVVLSFIYDKLRWIAFDYPLLITKH